MREVSELHKKWMEKPGYRQAYEEMRPEFEFASANIAARKRAKLTKQILVLISLLIWGLTVLLRYDTIRNIR